MAHDFKKFPELTDGQMLFYYNDSPHKQITQNFSAKCVRVIDGDTISVRVDFRDFEFPIRFSNTNAPEMSEDDGLASKKWLANQVEGEMVDVIIDEGNRVGKWGRIIGEIICNGVNVNEMSKAVGFAQDFELQEKFKIQPIEAMLR